MAMRQAVLPENIITEASGAPTMPWNIPPTVVSMPGPVAIIWTCGFAT